jgi:elongation factor 2
MPKLSPERLAELHRRPQDLRNVCVIAHVDHGKSTLTDSLVSGAGLLAAKDVGKVRKTDGRQDEQDRCITIKSTGISLYLERDDGGAGAGATGGGGNLINLIDCPGHVDFSSEVTAALRLCDGALVVVDCLEGTAVQTRTVLRQALTERVKPVLVINKLDRAFGETQDSPEELYERCRSAIDDVNRMIVQFQDGLRLARAQQADEEGSPPPEEGSTTAYGVHDFDQNVDWQVWPERGEVAFSVALHGWGFTIPQFAQMLVGKLRGVEGAESVRALSEKLWGEWYLDTKAKKFVQQRISPTTGRKLKRGFVQFILEPIMHVLRTCGLSVGRSDSDVSDELAGPERTWAAIETMMAKIGVPEDRWPKGRELQAQLIEGPPKELMRAVMMAWLPAHRALLSMVVEHLPSPPSAMQYRCEKLFTGPPDSDMARAIRACDPGGPLCVFISKHVPTKDNARFISFGRVFSGTLRTSSKVCILGPEYEGPAWGVDSVDDSADESPMVALVPARDVVENVQIQRTVVMMADRTEPADEVPCGNTVAMFGIDAHVNKTCTLVDAGSRKLTSGKVWPLYPLRYTVAPVVRVAVSPKNAAHVAKLAAALQKLSKSDPLVQIATVKGTGEHTVACAGELHLEICLQDLRELFLPADVEIAVSEPAVPHQETVTRPGDQCLAKSTNKKNRFWLTAEPLPPDLVRMLDSGEDGIALRAGQQGGASGGASSGASGANGANAKSTGTGIGTDAAAKARAQRLHREFGLDLTEARKVWAFGPEPEGGNSELARGGSGAMTCVLVDCTKAVQYLHEVRDTLVGAFHEVARHGVLAGEPLRGVMFKLHDALLHPDSPHRSPGQIVPAFKRAMHAAQLTAGPKLVEPVFLADITCADDDGACVGRVYGMLGQKRGCVVVEERAGGAGQLPAVRAHLPVAESFGFTSDLRAATGGEAFPQLSFDHWSVLGDYTFVRAGTHDHRDPSGAATELLATIRGRKQMALEPPALDKLADKL